MADRRFGVDAGLRSGAAGGAPAHGKARLRARRSRRRGSSSGWDHDDTRFAELALGHVAGRRAG